MGSLSTPICYSARVAYAFGTRTARHDPDYSRGRRRAQPPRTAPSKLDCPSNSSASSAPWPRPRLGNAVVVALQRHNKHHIPRTADQPDQPQRLLRAQQQARDQGKTTMATRTNNSRPHLLLLQRLQPQARLPSLVPAFLCPRAALRQRGWKGVCEVSHLGVPPIAPYTL